MSSLVSQSSHAARPLSTSAPARAWTLEQAVFWLLVAALTFFMGADFRGSTGGEFEVHWQIYLRLLLAFASGALGALLLFPRTYRDFFTWPGILLTLLLVLYLLSVAFSASKSYSFAAWSSLLGVTLFIPGALRVLGGFRYLTAVATGLSFYMVGSWIAYLLVPSVGVFEEQVSMTEVYPRMGGLGHPNELGFFAAYTVIIFAGLGTSKRIGWTIAGAGMLLGIVTLVGCFSRTAIIVCTLGLLVTFQEYIRLRSLAAIGMFLGAGVLTVVFFVVASGTLDWAIEDSLRGLSKSGSTDELKTGTGRTEIWAYGIKKIAERPVRGYGYCTTRFVMEDYSYHCHNIVLNAMMFAGILAGFLVLTMVLYHVFFILTKPLPVIDGLAVVMLTGGMVEGLLGAASPAASTILWFTLLFWRPLRVEV